ncbi:MAG: TetR/AcrR family transcriptional regulator [Actinobacteria bacterium]|nr:TetR/AcrR family transcriptional regulator [Actinomycetota bacterium]
MKSPIKGKPPEQARSIASMNRMLEAGEELFYEGGSSALTLDAVIERAGTSTGSFYARFGDMRGFLDAMHLRVLEQVSVEVLEVIASASKQPDLESGIRKICIDGFKVVSRNRTSLYFFAVGNSSDPHWRAMGTSFNLGMSDGILQLLEFHLSKAKSVVEKRRRDSAVRMMIAATFQQIMHDQNEISRIKVNEKESALALADMVCLYLRETPSK